MIFFSCSLMIRPLRRGPPITRSTASSRAGPVMMVPFSRAVSSAASLMTLARSAPVMPTVRLASPSRSASAAIGLPLECTRSTARRPARSGLDTGIWRSKRPGRNSAGSRMSGRLVAAIRMTPARSPKPSISTSNWLRVCSRSS
ncbi:Uncharacterised protein [Mycobacterium tuberculosis]|nr:Uncharacterised protein [Mycobacterium tuberculosis]CKS91632.1 Uncharacterised protein [Mycobacterium tuberculosis]